MRESCHGWEGRDDSPIGGATEEDLGTNGLRKVEHEIWL